MPARPFHDASEPTTRCLKNNCSGVAEVKLFQQHEETPKGCVMRWTSIVKAFRTEHHAHNRTMTEQGGRNKATYYPPFLTYLQLVCALLGNKTPKNTKKYLSQNKLKATVTQLSPTRSPKSKLKQSLPCEVVRLPVWWNAYYAEVWGSQRKMNMFN